ncbi:MAG: transposase [Synergistaceae bacterium]|nr:transposase [Synergistaceae bacterium]
MTYASAKGHAPIGRRLYMPEEWIEDRDRCKEAGVPETVMIFRTKPRMALEMIRDATAPSASSCCHVVSLSSFACFTTVILV